MGNQPYRNRNIQQTSTFQPSSINQKNTSIVGVSSFNKSETLIVLRIHIQNVLKQFEAQGQNVSEFLKQMKNKNIKRGENFEGSINQKGQVIGLAKYYRIKQKQSEYEIFFGECVKGVPVNRALVIKGGLLNASMMKDKINLKVDRESYDAYLIDDWSKIERTGSVIRKNQRNHYFFKGNINNLSITKGRLLIRQYGAIQMQYDGEFLNQNFNGRGVLLIPGRYRYQGFFERQKKNGIGEQNDYTRHTFYIGQFEDNKRNGYGELTYKNRDNAKLKGFWTDGIMKAGDGVYVGQDGNFLQIIGDDIQLI